MSWQFVDACARRTIDIVASSLGLIALSPLLVLIASSIKLFDRGPIFYRAVRIGKRGKMIHVYKFRTMVVNADRLGAGVTSSGDPRITVIGRWLRKTKLDELPQLFNVLRGDMALVGPRPEDPRYVALYTSEQQEILGYRPGITGAASLKFRNEEELLSGPNWERTYISDLVPTKIRVDLEYLSKRTVFTDISLILRTISSICFQKSDLQQ